jgi:hypothetical protein
MPLGAGRTGHPRHRYYRVQVLMVGQIPDCREPAGVGPGGCGERGDVLGGRRIGQRRELSGILPRDFAGQQLRRRAGRHQPGIPAGRRVVEVFVQVVRDATQVPGQVRRPPFRARRWPGPGVVVEPVRQVAYRSDAVAVGH